MLVYLSLCPVSAENDVKNPTRVKIQHFLATAFRKESKLSLSDLFPIPYIVFALQALNKLYLNVAISLGQRRCNYSLCHTTLDLSLISAGSLISRLQ